MPPELGMVCYLTFASPPLLGALIATAVFLIFPEALHLIEGVHESPDDHSDHSGEVSANEEEDHSGHNHRYLQEDSHDDSSESANAAKFGCAILGGFLMPFLFTIFFHQNNDEDRSAQGDDDICASCNVREGNIATGVTMKAQISDLENASSEPPSTIIKKIEEEPTDLEQPCNDCEEGKH
eukprot:278124_1